MALLFGQSLELWEKFHPVGCRRCRLLAADWLLHAFMGGFASSLALS
ncbi:hypothetical protein C8R21_11655 [Nitrosospira multiformis]|uniref:Uncharacterized protein n=1 Tax=Nitrosospira multiformis TaxID=1231 RepID=A0A2T5I9F8_9PROT|nr:hypothetical protein C8R21_11655 [Nitrosospira multiformis]